MTWGDKGREGGQRIGNLGRCHLWMVPYLDALYIFPLILRSTSSKWDFSLLSKKGVSWVLFLIFLRKLTSVSFSYSCFLWNILRTLTMWWRWIILLQIVAVFKEKKNSRAPHFSVSVNFFSILINLWWSSSPYLKWQFCEFLTDIQQITK